MPADRFGGVGFAWGAIRSAVAQRGDTAAIWAAVRSTAESLGQKLPPGAFKGVNELRSLAVQIRNTGPKFMKAQADDLFTPLMAPLGINARPAGDRELLPQYKATFELQYVNRDGEEESRTVSMIDYWSPDMTIGDVNDALWDSAEGLANDYGTSLVGWGGATFEMI